jgi:hypothetical protein
MGGFQNWFGRRWRISAFFFLEETVEVCTSKANQRTLNPFLAYITPRTKVPVLHTIRIKELAVIP